DDAARGEGTDDHRLPAARDVDQDVVAGELSILVEGPARHARASALALGSFGGVDRAGGGGAGGHPHDHRLVRPLVEQVKGGEVEIELRDRGVGEVADDRVDDLVPG